MKAAYWAAFLLIMLLLLVRDCIATTTHSPASTRVTDADLARLAMHLRTSSAATVWDNSTSQNVISAAGMPVNLVALYQSNFTKHMSTGLDKELIRQSLKELVNEDPAFVTALLEELEGELKQHKKQRLENIIREDFDEYGDVFRALA
ncbi:hypothetical protein [Nibrella viscosa]